LAICFTHKDRWSEAMTKSILIGLDVGSITVKAVVIDRATGNILWKDYQRHETHQPEKVLEFLNRIQAETQLDTQTVSIFCTGSGAGPIAPIIGARFVQEVNAVSLAARRLFPDARSVVELGGQDAKIIIFKEDSKTGAITTIPSMNDKCASGTGATIEKVARKVGVSFEHLTEKRYLPYKDNLVHIAAKCGVFAETDVIGHLKAGLPENQIMASLFDSIVSQNLAVLTRGHTLRPRVLLLGGPNTYIPGMVEAWRHHIPRIWEERHVTPPDAPLEELIAVPENSLYFAAIGCVEFALQQGEAVIEEASYRGTAALEHYISVDRNFQKSTSGSRGLWTTHEELSDFITQYTRPPFQSAPFTQGEVVHAFLGIDGGSTSTKAVIINSHGRVLAKAYSLSDGNPVQDTMDCVAAIRKQVEGSGATLKIEGVCTTGYAKHILAAILQADAAIVETVAHTMAARHVYPDVDVVVDVGGQDIKIIFLRDGRVSDFRLNTQCSAGNGYFLQSTAQSFNIPVDRYAEVAFQAERMPVFGYGCAVFMQTDIVNFQKEGWTSAEILAGLAAVLPKNIWLYVSKIPNLASLGRNFVLQGGTQYNLAAVKAQVDFIRQRFEGKGIEPNIVVHEHCGEAGAIGAALEACRIFRSGHVTPFIGLDRLAQITYTRTSDERTRCSFCKNRCQRTFVDVKAEDSTTPPYDSPVALQPGRQRIITGFSCDRGTVERVEDMRTIKAAMDDELKRTPNLADELADRAFRPVQVIPAISTFHGLGKFRPFSSKRNIESRRKWRSRIRIGMPRVLAMYSHAPFFMGYFESLGLRPENLVFSQTTSEKMYKDGAKRGAIDPCFPSKVCISHVHDLLFRIHHAKRLDCIFFPMIDSTTTPLRNVSISRACPTVAITPQAVKAAFTRENDVFAENRVLYLHPLVNLDNQPLLRRQMFDCFRNLLRLNRFENDLALQQGLHALEQFEENAQRRGREVLEMLVRERRLGFVVLARPYHNDDGLNHEILLKLQRLGYPILTQDSLPADREFLEPLFRQDLDAEYIEDPLEISDVWATPYSGNTSKKIWAAKVAARHPNLVALELSSFKCGLDAPACTVIERILEASQTPFFTFRDLDENAPTAAIKTRLETLDYFLKREGEKLRDAPSPAV
jgi:predicted CoA-substrate-specific enzyme activase